MNSYRINQKKKIIYVDRTRTNAKDDLDIDYYVNRGYELKLTSFKDRKSTVKGDKKPVLWFLDTLKGEELEEFKRILNDKSKRFNEKKNKEVKAGGFLNAKKAIYDKHPDLKEIELSEEELKSYEERAKKEREKRAKKAK